MSAQPTAANGAMGAISATTPRTVALLLLVPCPLWCAVALHLRRPRAGLPADRGTAVWVVPVHRHVPGVPAFQAAREDLDAPGRTIIVDPDPLEVRVESAALVPTMERLPVCPNADALPHE